jgi:hypothetical protein
MAPRDLRAGRRSLRGQIGFALGTGTKSQPPAELEAIMTVELDIVLAPDDKGVATHFGLRALFEAGPVVVRAWSYQGLDVGRMALRQAISAHVS